YRACANERISSTVARGTWTFSTDTLAYQLRAYLWHFFASFQRTVDQHIRGRDMLGPDSWLWTRVLKLLDTDFRLAVITFNYDLLATRILKGLIQGNLVGAVEMADPPLDERPQRDVPLLYAHGGISQFLLEPSDFARGPANPWLESIRIADNHSDASITAFR